MVTARAILRHRGDLTFISEGSEVLGNSTVELAGVDNNVGSGLQLSPGAFLDAGDLLGQGCVARRAGGGSTFARAGRGGLPPSPDRPLASSEAAEEGARQALRAGAGCRPRRTGRSRRRAERPRGWRSCRVGH